MLTWGSIPRGFNASNEEYLAENVGIIPDMETESAHSIGT